MPDPVANIVNRMLDHIHLMDERMDKLCEEIQRLGGKLEVVPLPALRAEGFGGGDSDDASKRDT
jgi:serine O-acetyltransferase